MSLRPAFPETPCRSYVSHENAIKAFERVCARLGVTEMVYVIAATPEGRFYPIALPGEAQVQNAIALAHHGVSMVRV